MTEPQAATPVPDRADLRGMALVFALALVVHVGTGVLAALEARVALPALGVYYDGHLYLEIARSFPLPFSPDGYDYLGQAPGYPAVAWLLRVVLPNSLVDWGLVMLLASWLPAALAAAAFWLLCREVGVAPLWPSLLFAVGNPRWIAIAGTAHPEPVAMLCAILSLIAFFRGRLGWCVAMLALAALGRYPAILVGGPLAFCVLVLRRQLDLRSFALLGVPLGVLAAANLYLWLRVPGFPGVLEAHSVFWETHLTWPFAALIENAERWLWAGDYPLFEVTYLSVAFYLIAIGLGLRRAERDRWILPLWVATLVFVHVSLSGLVGAWDFTRLVILAWPAALLIVWRPIGPRIPAGAAAALCVAACVFGVWFTSIQTATAVRWQLGGQTFLRDTIAGLDSDEPRWIDFRELVRQRRLRRPTPR